MQYIWGLRARFRFALRNPMRNPLVTWQQGDRICGSHFLARSEERAALILDTLNLESRPPVELSPHHRIPPPRPLPPPDADQPTLTQNHRHPSDRQHVRSLPLPVEADCTGKQSQYSLLPPVTVPHRGTPPALSHSSVTPSGRRSVSAPLPLSENALPPRSSLLHPPPRTSLLPTAAYADNRHTPRVLTFATSACRIVARCGSICPPTTIYSPTRPTWGGIFFERTSVFERRFESSKEDSNWKIVFAFIAIQLNPIESKLLGRFAANAQRQQRAHQIDRRSTQICARKTQICARRTQICARKKGFWFFQLICCIF